MRKVLDTHRNAKCLKSLLFAIVIVNIHTAIAQQSHPGPEILSPDKVSALLTDSQKQAFKLNYPIFRVYRYTDQSGQYYCVLTESRDVTSAKDTMNQRIKAVNLKMTDGTLSKTWELNDNITQEINKEQSIWFWTKYAAFEDYDHDGLVEPIIIYGSRGENGYDDGRSKILIYYKGQKVAVRHQNGVLDDERSTQVDAAFYTLPVALQTAVKERMEMLVKDDHAIFPDGWQSAMRSKKTSFDD